MKKILIIRLSSMGDVVLTSPLIRCIHNKYPDSIIDFVVDKKYSDVLKYNPYLNNIIEYDKNDARHNLMIKKKLDTNYTIIDLQNNRRSKLFRAGLGKIVGAFNKYRLQKLALVWLKKDYFNGITIPERYINTASTINIENDNNGLEVWLPDENNLTIYPPENKIYSNTIKTITIVPSATHYTKRWLPEYFVKLIEMIYDKYQEIEINLLGDANDIPICNYITSNLNNNLNSKINIINNSGHTTILEATQIIDKSDLVISNDTGMLHITSARKVPVIAIYGSTTPAFGFIPYKVPNRICEIEMDCRPCSHIGKKECHKKSFNCMKLLTPEIVFEKVEDLIK